MMMGNNPHLRTILDTLNFSTPLSDIDPIQGASVYAGLMLYPMLQSNAFRLESLVHLLLGQGQGTTKLNKKTCCELFNGLIGTHCQYNEDPAEDVMVTLVHHLSGSYRILEGLWESSAFHLQQFINIVKNMPDTGNFISIKVAVWSMLRISDVIIARSGIERYSIGNTSPLSEIDEKLLSEFSIIEKRISFTKEEFQKIGVNPLFLDPFIYSLDNKTELLNFDFGYSPLEQKPIIS
jgi:hypothetical protein